MSCKQKTITEPSSLWYTLQRPPLYGNRPLSCLALQQRIPVRVLLEIPISNFQFCLRHFVMPSRASPNRRTRQGSVGCETDCTNGVCRQLFLQLNIVEREVGRGRYKMRMSEQRALMQISQSSEYAHKLITITTTEASERTNE